MKKTLLITGIIIALAITTVAAFASTYNRAVSLEEQIASAESDIQIQEKRRTDLIYNLVDCVKEYDKHEAETLMDVIETRSEGSETIADNAGAQIVAVAEAYPDLKASENYKELMNELSITENKIAEHRKTYNNQVRAYNKYVRKFPNKQILSIEGYETINYTYLEYSVEDKQPVSGLFSD